MIRPTSLITRLQYALRHICWPRWCARHALAYVSDFCPECNGARLTKLEVVDGRNLAHLSMPTSGEADWLVIERLLAFDMEEVRRHVRGRRRNGLHRALAEGEIAGATPHR